LLVVWPQNHWDGFLLFGLKISGDDFSRFEPQNRQSWFGDLGLKITVTVFFVWASKPSRLQFIGCASKPTGGCDDVGHTSRSNSLLQMEASRARVFQFGLKTGGVATAGGARGTIPKVASMSN
jgi:hypothetical protein